MFTYICLEVLDSIYIHRYVVDKAIKTRLDLCKDDQVIKKISLRELNLLWAVKHRNSWQTDGYTVSIHCSEQEH